MNPVLFDRFKSLRIKVRKLLGMAKFPYS